MKSRLESKLRPPILLSAALIILSSAPSRTLASALYAITDLGTVDGYALNNSGQVAGASYDETGLQHAFFYSNGTTTDLGTLGGLEAAAFGLNNSGQVVGWSDTTNGTQHAFLYSSGTLTDLGTLGGSNSFAYAISDDGRVAGWSETTSGVAHAFFYRSGTMTDLGPGYASGINTNGQVTGWTVVSSAAWHAFLYSGGVLSSLGTLGGPVSEGLGINEAGQVAGWSETTNGTQHAFLYSGGAMMDLGTLTGTNSRAFALNNNAEVVGAFDTNDLGGLHAFIYKTGSATDLNALIDTNAGWVLSYPSAINDKGSILLNAIRPSDYFHTLLLTLSSPPPSSSPILTINIVGNSIVVSWPATVTGYQLFQSPNLLPSSWTLVPITPVVTNGLNEVIFSPIPPGKQYFRLQSQASPSSPSLAINITVNSLVVSWPANVTGFRLTQSPNLLPSSWTAVTNTPVVTNGLNEVIFSPIPLDNRFFRLQSP